MVKHVLTPDSHMTWYITTVGDTWIVKKGTKFKVYNGDGISDSAAQHNSRIEVYGHIIAPDGEGVDAFGRNNTVYIASSGLIQTSHGYGIAFEGTAYNGTVENHGRIISNFGGVSMTGVSPQSHHASTAEVMNYGRISGGSYGIDSRSDDITVRNMHGGYIFGGQYGIGSVENDVTVYNAGTIKGGPQGAIYLNTGNDTVSNAGSILGDVFLGNGNDVYINRSGGRVTGVINAGTGADTYVVNTRALKLHEDDFSDIDTVKSSVSWTLGDNFEKLVLTGTKAINGTGTKDADTISGNSAGNVLKGLGGDDVLRGNGGADHFVFGDGCGHDTIVDFRDNFDRIDLRPYLGIDSIRDIDSIVTKHGDAIITLSDMDTITVNNVLARDLTARDFIF